MRLLQFSDNGEITFTKDLVNDVPPYAILSHTWGEDEDEVTFDDIQNKRGKAKKGYAKIQFCGKQALRDGLQHFWVDTCAINKASHSELSEAITSMFRWYHDAARCYVYLADVSTVKTKTHQPRRSWKMAFRQSRWFQRGWTLQELLAPRSVRFFSREGEALGTRESLQQLIHEITTIPAGALQGTSLSEFSGDERLRWSENRQTKRPEDRAYCLLGIFGVFMSPIYGERENAFVRLKEEIAKRSGSSVSPTPVHWMVSRYPNPLFTGRGDILQKFEDTVNKSRMINSYHEQCRIVVCGLGGQGKSEICLQLAYHLRQSFWAVFWVDVSTVWTAESAFLSIARRLNLSAQSWKEACLGIANLKHPWLLVLDNADDLDTDYQEYIPNGPSGVVILTSRDVECQQYATSWSTVLEGLTDAEAQELLLKAARASRDGIDNEDVHKVTDLLQCHPLALVQAGAYISSNHCTLAEYPDVYQRHRQQLLTFRPRHTWSRWRDVYATFEASAEILKVAETRVSQDALQLLPLLAMCGSNRFPLPIFEASWEGARKVPSDMENEAEDNEVELLTPWHVSRMPSFIKAQNQTWNSFRLVEAVNQLRACALVSTDTSDGFLSVSMHPLIHAWARDRQSNEDQHQNWLQMATLFAFLWTGAPLRYPSAWSLGAHVEALVEWKLTTIFATKPQNLVCRILVNCGWLLFNLRSDTKLAELMKRLLRFLELSDRKVQLQWVGLYCLVAHSLQHKHKLKRAITLHEQIVEIREKSLPEDHRERSTSLYTLAHAYLNDGRVNAAVTTLEKVVEIEKLYLPENDFDRLSSQHELARAYKRNGQLDSAAALLEEIVKIKQQYLPENNPSRLASEHQLARTFLSRGQVVEATAILEKVVKINEQSYPDNHSIVLSSQHNLASCYWSMGQLDNALKLMRHVVQVRRRILDEDHPTRTNSEGWLSDMEKEMAELQQQKA